MSAMSNKKKKITPYFDEGIKLKLKMCEITEDRPLTSGERSAVLALM